MSCQLYLISPPRIKLPEFADQLRRAFDGGKIAVFQLRLKNATDADILQAAETLLPICHDNNSVFLLNDNTELAVKCGADGVHLGRDDMAIKKARAELGEDMVIGASCYDSTDLAMQMAEDGADYVAFGSFFASNTKTNPARPSLQQLADWSFASNVPAVAIGGITPENCAPLIENGADFLAVISAVWDNPSGADKAVQKFHKIIAATNNKAVSITAD